MSEIVDFGIERHRIWERRRNPSTEPPWSEDPILKVKKFCNLFRALDHGSQFLLGELILGDDSPIITREDALFRVFMYRYTNTPEPWRAFKREFGRYPLREDIGSLREFWKAYNADGNPVAGTAYKMFVGHENKGMDRVSWVASMGERYFHPSSPECVTDTYFSLTTLADKLAYLQTIPRTAEFMSMQIATDMVYSGFDQEGMTENDTVILGPGAKRGAKYVQPGLEPYTTFMSVARELWDHHECPLMVLPDGRGHDPSLMDIQNLFCEYSKYRKYHEKGNLPTKAYAGKHVTEDPVIPPTW